MNLDELNESQRQAVLCIDAPSLVIAGAGSGKTRVLTYKIAYLLEQGMQPWNILALTFTNKAAREMRERIASLVSPEKAASLWMGTFHSIFARILRLEAHRLGYTSNFTIYDTADSQSLLRLIIRDMGLDEKVYKPAAVHNRISNAKNRLVLPDAYGSVREWRESDIMTGRTAMPEIYRSYCQRTVLSNAMDFDDLLLNMWRLLNLHPEVAEQWQERFHFVLVDEYQDTNYAQHSILWLLTRQRQRLCVVGDDAQSIYSFRGADIDGILRFQDTYSGTRLFKLEQNYRSTQTIVAAAGSLISNNSAQIPKHVFSMREAGNPIALRPAYSDTDEAEIVLREVLNAHRAGVPYSSMAILYRTNAQSRKMEDAMLAGRVPYRICAGTSFYQREEIKDFLCYLRLALNPNEEESLRRVINKPARGIGNTTLTKLLAAAAAQSVTVWQVLEQGKCPGINAGTMKRLTDFRCMIEAFHQSAATDDAHTIALRVLRESGMHQALFSGHEPDDVARQENIQELLDGIAAFVADSIEQGQSTLLADFLLQASLATDQDRTDQGSDEDCLSMMTVHAAKGLEFSVVFIVGLEEGLFPSDMSLSSPRALEEERRLFYVALTRAARQVVLTYAKSRFRFGKVEYAHPSRFLSEIPQQYYGNTCRPRPATAPRPLASAVRSASTPALQATVTPSLRRLTPFCNAAATSRPSAAGMPQPGLHEGTTVIHERFGRGVVQRIEGTGLDARATVAFENAGNKVLLLRFAKLTIE